MPKIITILVIFATSMAALAEEPIKALLVTGGCCHDYSRQKLIISKGVSARANVRWTLVQQGGTTTNTRIPLYEDEGWADGFDIVVHNECFAAVKDTAWVDRVLKPHLDGTPGVVIHCAMHCYRTGDDRWFKFCGVQSPNHGPHYPFTLKNVWKDHFIMQDFGESWKVPKGELYNTVKTFDGVSVLAQGIKEPGGDPQTSIWAHEYGPNKTRVFGTTVGHYNHTMAEPTYLDVLTRGILWATGRETELKPVSDETHAAIKTLIDVPLAGAKTIAPKAVVIEGNLAAGKKGSAKSEETNKRNFVAHALDGNPQTRWCASGAQSGEWFQVDLGKPHNVQSLRIRWEQPGTTYQYTVEASADGKSWKTIIDASKAKKANGFAGHDVKAPGTQFLRVTNLGSSGGWASIYEFEVYDKKLPPVPKAAAVSGFSTASVADVQGPEGFEVTLFGKPPTVNYPECLTAAISGEVFVGVDEQGSLGKEPGRGKVLRCVDIDGDGVADDIKTFAKMDHPRGLIFDNHQLWVLHPPNMTRYTDTDGDGVADEEKRLITGISTDYVKKRGADHTTNGIRMGIDGWIYIAVGDFGFYKAVGADGTEISRRGGGIVRIRPDGSDMEIYCWGLRNILDVSIDPYLNIFTRDNTNDGGGWNVRLTHILQTAEYGYPSLYLNYTDEIMPTLNDYGGGSGCGAMYLHDDRWPESYRDALYTCDWGTSKVYRHNLPAHGPTFDTHQEIFLSVPRVTDIDVDGSGLMYVSSWKGGGFSYSKPDVGFVAQIRPANFLPKPAPNLAKASDDALVDFLVTSPSANIRLHAQREILRRDSIQAGLIAGPLSDPETPLFGKVAAIYTLKQKFGAKANGMLASLYSDASIREHVLRAMTDRKRHLEGVPADLFVTALKDSDPRVRAQALVGLGRLGKAELASHLLPLTQRTESVIYAKGKPEYTQPDPGRVLPHLAVRALDALQAADTCLAGLDGPHRAGALWALKYQHNAAAVDGLVNRLAEKKDADTFAALVRLYHREGAYSQGWWGTRPDRTGPYYDRKTWEQSEKIGIAIRDNLPGASAEVQQFVHAELGKHKVDLKGLPKVGTVAKKGDEQAPIQVPKTAGKDKNLIANLGYEDVLLRATKAKGDANKGKALFTSQSCVACHTDKDGMAPKGPHLVDIGKRYPRPELIESLIKPNAKIAQGFNTFVYTMKNKMVYAGFTVSESADTITIRQITGIENALKVSDIVKREEIPQSMMPEGLQNNLTPEQLADLLAYLESI